MYWIPKRDELCTASLSFKRMKFQTLKLEQYIHHGLLLQISVRCRSKDLQPTSSNGLQHHLGMFAVHNSRPTFFLSLCFNAIVCLFSQIGEMYKI